MGLVATAAVSPQAQPVVVPAPPPVAQTAPELPIVPDQEFEKALPPLSNDINAPLEAIEPAPIAADAATPVDLAQPLPPLGTFDTTPLVDVTVKDPDAPEIRYDTVLRGLDALKLSGQFNGLSALKQGGGKAPNATVISARGREDEELAVRLMKSLGYYDGTAVSTLETVPDDKGRVRAIVSATTGQAIYAWLDHRECSADGARRPDRQSTAAQDRRPDRGGARAGGGGECRANPAAAGLSFRQGRAARHIARRCRWHGRLHAAGRHRAARVVWHLHDRGSACVRRGACRGVDALQAGRIVRQSQGR